MVRGCSNVAGPCVALESTNDPAQGSGSQGGTFITLVNTAAGARDHTVSVRVQPVPWSGEPVFMLFCWLFACGCNDNVSYPFVPRPGDHYGCWFMQSLPCHNPYNQRFCHNRPVSPPRDGLHAGCAVVAAFSCPECGDCMAQVSALLSITGLPCRPKLLTINGSCFLSESHRLLGEAPPNTHQDPMTRTPALATSSLLLTLLETFMKKWSSSIS